MLGYVFAALMLMQTATPAPQDEIKQSLAKAEALYDDARFNDAVQLLLHVNEDLRAKADRVQDKTSAKRQLALAYIGMNDNEKAKASFIEMFTLDPNAALDPQQYAPKVIELAATAKGDLAKTRCLSIGDNARKSLKDGNVAAVRNLIGSPDSKCVDMAAIGPDASDLLYKAGMEGYKRADYSSALQDFQAAVKFSAKNELASQYVELTQGKLQVAEDKALLQWQKNFDAHQFTDAASDFRQIVAFNDVAIAPAVQKAGDQYRKALTTLVDTWNRTCPNGDAAAMNTIRGQIVELLPDPAFAEDIRSRMTPCTRPEPKAEAKPEVKPEIKTVALTNSAGSAIPAASPALPVSLPASAAVSGACMQIDYRVAMTRLKTRVEPEVPREARAFMQSSTVAVRVKIRIDENGNVTSADTSTGNPMFTNSVKTAVERWKFSAAMDATGARCVDTEIPFTFGPSNSR